MSEAAEGKETGTLLKKVLDRQAVEDLVTRMFVLTDNREWKALTECFAARVLVDYTSLSGGEPATVAREDLVASWKGLLEGFKTTQHLATNYLVDLRGDEATLTASFQAQHYLPDDHGESTWTLGGSYRIEAIRESEAWRISAITMTARWAKGNQNLMTLASQRGQDR